MKWNTDIFQESWRTVITSYSIHYTKLYERDKVIGLAFDGTGYGTDGKMWGGEVLICSYENFDRVGHLNYIALPGGEAAVKEPWRSALSYLRESFTEDIPDELIEVDPMKKKVVLQMLKTGLNSPKTSSMGRFLTVYQLFWASSTLPPMKGSRQ